MCHKAVAVSGTVVVVPVAMVIHGGSGTTVTAPLSPRPSGSVHKAVGGLRLSGPAGVRQHPGRESRRVDVPSQGVRVLLHLRLQVVVVARNPSGGRHLDVRDRHGFRLRKAGELKDGVGVVYPPSAAGVEVGAVHGRVLVLDNGRLVVAAAPAHRVAGRVPDAAVLGLHHRPHVHSGGDEGREPPRAEARGEDGRGEEGGRAGVVERAEVRAARGTHVADLGVVLLQGVCCSLQENILHARTHAVGRDGREKGMDTVESGIISTGAYFRN